MKKQLLFLGLTLFLGSSLMSLNFNKSYSNSNGSDSTPPTLDSLQKQLDNLNTKIDKLTPVIFLKTYKGDKKDSKKYKKGHVLPAVVVTDVIGLKAAKYCTTCSPANNPYYEDIDRLIAKKTNLSSMLMGGSTTFYYDPKKGKLPSQKAKTLKINKVVKKSYN